jgi:hypothetical protein
MCATYCKPASGSPPFWGVQHAHTAHGDEIRCFFEDVLSRHSIPFPGLLIFFVLCGGMYKAVATCRELPNSVCAVR